MTGIDTNILVRFQTRDTPHEYAASRAGMPLLPAPEDQIPIASPAPISVSTPSTAKMAAAIP